MEVCVREVLEREPLNIEINRKREKKGREGEAEI